MIMSELNAGNCCCHSCKHDFSGMPQLQLQQATITGKHQKVENTQNQKVTISTVVSEPLRPVYSDATQLDLTSS